MLQPLASTPAPGPGRGWKRFTLAAVAAGVVFLVIPDASWPQSVAFSTVGLLAASFAWRRARGSQDMVAWRWMAVGVAGNALGSFVEAFLSHVLHSDAFPSLADVCYLSLYPGLGIGLALLVRRRAGGSLEASLLDSSIITAGAGLLSWVTLIHPLADSADLGRFGRVVSVAYPLADLLLLAIVTRLLLTTSLRTVAYRYVFAAVGCFLLDDTTWGVINHNGWAVGPWASKTLQLAVLAAYVLVGVGSAHPSAHDDHLEEAERAPGLRPPMLMALTVAALTAPAVLGVQAMAGRVTDGASVAVGSALLFLLVVARMAGLLAQVERQAALLRDLALVDELTGLANRRALMADLARSCQQAQRSGQALAVAVLDLDHFKQYNDLFGHVEGDRLLARTAQAWQQRLRGADVLGRFGGEEFVVVMPGTEIGTAEHVLAALRAATPADLTVSGGLASWRVGETPEAVIRRADDALYVAKSRGRDRVVVAPTELARP
jgi:diguanylate cyclase